MRRSCVAIAAATLLAAALPLSAMARQVEKLELGLPVEVSGSPAGAGFDATKVSEASPSTVKPSDARASISDVAEPESYVLLLAGLAVLVFVARRRRLD